MMVHARRRAVRYQMLPHIAGKFDRERFVRTGFKQEYGYFAPPDTPTMRAAREQVEAERRYHEGRRHGG